MNKLAYYNQLRHEKALEAYLANPSICLHCSSVISPEGRKIAEVRVKKFCNSSCAASYNNKNTPYRNQNNPNEKKERKCRECGATFYGSKSRRFCADCSLKYKERISGKTRAECSHRDIRGNAVSSMNGRERICQNCGYSKFVEICHIKPVAKFPGTARVSEINAPSNLIYLCPNCHWELDHGMLALKQ